MVVDLRLVAKDDWRSKLSLISRNIIDEGGLKPVSIFRSANYVIGDQYEFLAGIVHADEVEGDQIGVAALANFARKVEKDQLILIGGMNCADEVGLDQGGGFNVANVADKVGRNQGGFMSGINSACHVEGDQGGIAVGINLADKVKKDQGGNICGLNYADKVGGEQKGFINIQIKNNGARQKGLVRYNSLEGIGLGSSVWIKIERANEYLDKLRKSDKEDNSYASKLEALASVPYTLRKKLTGHYTTRDAIKRQSGRKLRRLKKVKESQDS